ncbi:MAG: thiol-disulfide oxidoreductase DCC family protein [Calditrichaceae bacterium]
MDKQIVLYDGICKFCNGSVRFIIKRDSARKFSFAHLDSDKAKEILKLSGIRENYAHSIVLFREGSAYLRSSAALRIVKELDGLWPVLYVFILIPGTIRDWIYDLIANHRYRWFGKYESCPVPDTGELDRFLT